MNLNGATHEAKEPKYSLLLLDREGLVKAWNTVIRPGLERVKNRDKRSGYWEPEHVRQRLEAGLNGNIICECRLILRIDSTTPLGFIILTAYNDEFLNVPLYLHGWIGWCEFPKSERRFSRKSNLDQILAQLLPQLRKRAEELGLRGVQFVTSRYAWLYRLTRYGFHVHQYVVRWDFKESKK